MFDPRYEPQVRLLLRCLTLIHSHGCFALKGGTAINLFLQDLPRISVDIDLAYLPLKPRDEALREISDRLEALKDEVRQRVPGATVEERRVEGHIARLLVGTRDAAIKIEPNLVFRGSVYPPEERVLTPTAQNQFGAFVRSRCLSRGDLYGSKLCAALDRQHPRDLFDVKLLIEGEGITPEIRRACVVYLAGHNRPISELLSPQIQEIGPLYERQFAGMARVEVPLSDLTRVQRELPRMLRTTLDEDERAFLLSLKRGEPEWDLLGIAHLAQLPALQWKLLNVRRMERDKWRAAFENLERVLQAE